MKRLAALVRPERIRPARAAWAAPGRAEPTTNSRGQASSLQHGPARHARWGSVMTYLS